ncbi:hypothetical protein [Ralstonia solanacearum]|uniref:hypothetical protein n=1 Tax=Ralstonia solanacearum TaxID=305 RepID=UPI0018D0591A|nr:hypothetical protein [Ralstonia solanacearum]
MAIETHMWEAIQHVTTGLTLVALLVTVIAWVYKSKVEQGERLIRAVSEAKRADLVRLTLEFFDVDTTGLTKEQKYELALAQIHARAQRFRTTAIVVCVLAVILAAVSAYAMSQNGAKPPAKGQEELKPASQTEAESKIPTKEPLINEVGEWNRESCHLGFSD